MMTATPLSLSSSLPIEARGIHKRYGAQQVLAGVDLVLAPGSVLGLIGRNGAGKSTLIRILLGLLAADAGEAHIFGQPALALDDAGKSAIGHVPQQPAALAWLKVGNMLDFVGQHYPVWDADFVRQMLARWQLPADKPLAKLSPGERQRVALIRALAPRPRLLVLDEPAAALDPVARRELLREIAERAAEQGTTVLFSTHIVSDLERVASHVAFLHQGRILLHDELDAIKERHLRLHVPASHAAMLIGAVPGEVARRHHADGSLAITLIRAANTPWPALASAPGVTRQQLALEDLFLEIAG